MSTTTEIAADIPNTEYAINSIGILDMKTHNTGTNQNINTTSPIVSRNGKTFPNIKPIKTRQ